MNALNIKMHFKVNFKGLLYNLRRKNLYELTKIQIILLIINTLRLKKSTNT